jgi:hypothetical protein
MSDALAISAVSFVLQYYLFNLYSTVSAEFGGNVQVSSLAPDMAQALVTGATSPQPRVNLFLHQVTFNPSWRNVGLPSLAADGATRLKNPPLALDLHYLLTAYGTVDWQAEALLGYALLMMHQNPVIARADITAAFNALPGGTILPPYEPGNPVSSFLAASGLADQLEMIKITPATLGREEMAWLWTALKADYRPTFPFQVSVVLITPPVQTTFSFPVISVSLTAQPGPPAQLLQVAPPTGVAVPASGDTVTITGLSLAGATQVTLTNARLGIDHSVAPTSVTDTTVKFVVPPDTAANPMPAGTYELSLLLVDPNGNQQRTGTIQLAVAPVIVTATATTTAANTTVNVTCSPNVTPAQSVSFILDSLSAPAQPIPLTTNSLNFQFTPPLIAGSSHVMRLQVDGISSQVNLISPLPAAPPYFKPTVTV